MLDPQSPSYVGRELVYLTEAIDRTEEYGHHGRTVYQVIFSKLNKSDDFKCSFILMDKVVEPDDILAFEHTGLNKKLMPNANRSQYYQVLLNFNDQSRITFLHEDFLKNAEWSTDDTDSQKAFPVALQD